MQLSEREVHLWSVPLHETEPSAALLVADEWGRAERFRCLRARTTFIQTRAALRLLLGHYLDRAPLAVALTSGVQGKPRLGAGMAALHFNVSHSGRLALIALSQAAVGVDLEEQSADLGWRELLPVCCHRAERSAFQDATDAVGRARLLGLWTAKEAYLKGRGEGLSLPLTAIRLQACRGGWQPVIEAPWDDGRGWWLRALSLPAGYVGCLATPFPAPLIRFQPLADLRRNGRAEGPVTPMSCYP